MTLTLVTGPTQPVVDSQRLLEHRRADDPADTAELVALEQAAVAYLDGYSGILGRAIRSQVWRQEFSAWGTLRLAMPDVSAITVTGLTVDGSTVAATKADLRVDEAGPYVIAEGPEAERVFVQFTCAMPAHQLPAVQLAVKLLVGHWFENREAVGPGDMAQIPMAVNALLAPLQWGRT